MPEIENKRFKIIEEYQPVTPENPITHDEVRNKITAIKTLRTMVVHGDTNLWAIKSIVEAINDAHWIR